MDAAPILEKIAKIFAQHHLNAVMIGNAAAALQGAPVTTEDVDFMIEQTPENYRTLAVIAQDYQCTLYEMELPEKKYMYRLVAEDNSFSLDILFAATGIKNFTDLRKRATLVDFNGHLLQIASLEDILKSKRAAGRPKDIAVIPILETTLDEKKRTKSKNVRLPPGR